MASASPSNSSSLVHLVAGHKTYILPSVTLESGATITDVPVAYNTWGTLNAKGTNCVVVCHALSGSSDVSDWWGPLFQVLDTDRFFVIGFNVFGSPYGSASPLTLNPSASSLPPDLRPPCWPAYGPDFPSTTVRDDVRAHERILRELGVTRVQCVIGGSMGGFAALEWCLLFPSFVRTVIPVATSSRHSAWCVSWSEVQRQAIFADPVYDDGYYHPSNPPRAGLTAARMCALMTYRARVSTESRFSRRRVPTLPATRAEVTGGPAPVLLADAEYTPLASRPAQAAPKAWPTSSSPSSPSPSSPRKFLTPHAVLHSEGSKGLRLYPEEYEVGYVGKAGKGSLGGESSDTEEKVQTTSGEGRVAGEDEGVFYAQTYLRHHGRKFLSRFDPNCYVHITRKMDTHDVARGRVSDHLPDSERVAAVLGTVKQPALVIAVSSDFLYPVEEQEELARGIPNSRLRVVDSLHGHDGFLIELKQVNKHIQEFLKEFIPENDPELAEASPSRANGDISGGLDVRPSTPKMTAKV
ncbi:homoserine O-acetyltransferase [Gonapodya prolifera JEL478]|uniref:Homoserine O-acetyltransferase n=1 Tax=Gonapodya prolifera (strain JEL478) TaxID=1344416 RepID=A0A139AWT0_GONPJ|nr:homoserine O-acetyltransferase [Gonapodya prolifera JEL478]|eukprot:KXS21178.1 homoserine O-acetyltransferase [Gonapodya prolifera JEL478]